MKDYTYLSWPFFVEEHRVLAKTLETWAKRELKDSKSSNVDAACKALVRQLADAGWLKYCVPEAYGGVCPQLDIRSLCLIRETLAYHSGLADFSFAMQGLGSGPITLFGSEEQKKKYLQAVSQGEKIAAFALSEPDAGSDVGAIGATAQLDGDHYVLNGTKTWISNGGIADFYTVFARTGEAGTKELSAFVVDANTPGLEIAERIHVIAPHPLAWLQ
ncbi:MAG TPA: acyl-CoA dehydrogenase family protein, partial [Candidatus Bipolaricaulota bacterium]